MLSKHETLLWQEPESPERSNFQFAAFSTATQQLPPIAVAAPPQPQSSATGFHINLLYDASARAAPQSFRDGIQAAANILETTFSDNITVNLHIHYGGTGGGAFAGPDNGVLASYSTVRADLIDNATPGDHTFDALPNSFMIQGQSQIVVWNAEAKVLGLLPANDATSDDGSASFSTDINPNLLVGVALHELTHALGRVPSAQPDIFDLFRFITTGVYLFDENSPALAPAYFSLDGGQTRLADYGVESDPSDFLNSGVQGDNDPFNEFYTWNTQQHLTIVDLQQMVALGYHVAGQPVAGADLTVSFSLTGATVNYRVANIGTADAAASGMGVFLSDDSTITTADSEMISSGAPALAAGAFVDGSLSLPSFVTPGLHYIGIIVDPGKEIAESNESNNLSAVVPIIFGDYNANSLNGSPGNDTILSMEGNDIIAPGAGNDSVAGGDGDDTISFGGNLTAADRVDGGDGADRIILQGDYATTPLVLAADTISNVEFLTMRAGTSYSLTTNNATVAAGQSFSVNASALGAANSLVFNGAAELDGRFIIQGGAGKDDITTGSGKDTIVAGAGTDVIHPGPGNDTVLGGDGNDYFSFGKYLTAADRIDGGAGTADEVAVQGNYANPLVFSATTMINVEYLMVRAGNNYAFTTHNATVAAGQTLTVNASALGAANTLVFNGAAESDGHFVILGGAGNDRMTGGNGGDTFTGGAGADSFVYTSAAQSTGSQYDTITGLDFAADRIDVPGAGGTINAIDSAIAAASLSSATFDSDLGAALSGNLGAHHALQMTANAGTLQGQSFLVVDLNGVAGYQAGQDLVIHLANATGSLATTDFI
jgi:Ca2+-binding RTX toxin-like protein